MPTFSGETKRMNEKQINEIASRITNMLIDQYQTYSSAKSICGPVSIPTEMLRENGVLQEQIAREIKDSLDS